MRVSLLLFLSGFLLLLFQYPLFLNVCPFDLLLPPREASCTPTICRWIYYPSKTLLFSDLISGCRLFSTLIIPVSKWNIPIFVPPSYHWEILNLAQVFLSLLLHACVLLIRGYPGGSDSKESSCKAGDPGSIPELGRFPGEENGYPLQYSCLKNSMNRGAWWAIVHGVTKNQTWLSNRHFHVTFLLHRVRTKSLEVHLRLFYLENIGWVPTLHNVDT